MLLIVSFVASSAIFLAIAPMIPCCDGGGGCCGCSCCFAVAVPTVVTIPIPVFVSNNHY